MFDVFFYFFVFKQKTAYEVRISDWSSDVCSSDLASTARGIGGDCEWRACRTTSGLRGILIACLDVLDCLTGAMGDMRKALYVFPDTNVFVQCQSLEELAWSDLGTFDLIVLLLSSPVIGEIDRQKGGAGRLAKRARTANTLIRRLLDEDSVAIKTKKKGPVVVVETE